MIKGRGMGRLLRAVVASAIALTMLPLPLLTTPTAEAWDTGAGYRQDENILRTVGVSAGARSALDFASENQTEDRGITTSYFAGQATAGGTGGGTIVDLTAANIGIAYLLLRDTRSERWVGLAAINDQGTGQWGTVRGAAWSLWGTGQKDATSSNPRSSTATAAGGGAPTVNILTGNQGRYSTANNRRHNGIEGGITGSRSADASANALTAIGSCACEGNTNGRAAFLTTAQITSVSGATGDTLTIGWTVSFATPQVGGPVEIWSGVESFGSSFRNENATANMRNYYDGWDRYATRTIGTVPFVGITSVPSGVTAGTQAQFLVEATDPEGNIDAADIDMRAVMLHLVDQASGDFVTLIYYHRKSDATKIFTTDDEKYQILRSNGTYSSLSDGSTISHAWLDFDQPLRTSSGDNLRVTFPVTFKDAARGRTFVVYARVMDREYNDSGLRRIGTTTVQ